MIRHATNDAVAIAWVNHVLGSDLAGSQVPEDNSTWAASGFVAVQTVGGGADSYYNLRKSTIGLQVWTCDTQQSGQPPWGKAHFLAESIRAATYSYDQPWLDIPYCDERVRVMTTRMIMEPRRKYGDTGDYACVNLHIGINWTTI